jgi:hypothetical protein
LKNSVLPELKCQQLSVNEIVNLLRTKSQELDTVDAKKSGVNFVLNAQAPGSLVTLELKDVPLLVALDNICSLAGLRYRVDQHAVVITPAGPGREELEQRVYVVPKNFLPTSSIKGGDADAARTVLMGLGANLDAAGCEVHYLPENHRLVVRAPLPQLDHIEWMVDELRHKQAGGSPSQAEPEPEPFYDEGGGDSQGAVILQKLKKIKFEELNFENALADQVLTYLASKSVELDTVDPNKTGVNFIIQLKGQPASNITLSLRNVSLLEALRLICDGTELTFRVDEHAVVITRAEVPSRLETRVFRVRRTFLQALNAGASPPKSAKEILMSLGVNFEAVGSMAAGELGEDRIIIKNTLQELDALEEVVDRLNRKPLIVPTSPAEIPASAQAAAPAPAMDPFAPPQAAKALTTGQRMISNCKLKILTKHYEETLADIHKEERNLAFATDATRERIIKEIEKRRTYLSAVESQLKELTSAAE